jgi:hypothetical protein
MNQPKFVNGPQGRLHVDGGGLGEAVPVLFVHGGGDRDGAASLQAARKLGTRAASDAIGLRFVLQHSRPFNPNPAEGVFEMPEHLKRLIELARRVIMSDADREEQRRSFAYGNIKIENDMVTREIVDEEAEKLTAGHAR